MGGRSRFLISLYAMVIVFACAFQVSADFVDTTIIAGAQPDGIAVDTVTNKIYVANYSGSNFTVINGITDSTIMSSAGATTTAVAVNPVTNTIYMVNFNHDSVTVIKGATNSATSVAVGFLPVAIAVNPVTNMTYVANSNRSGGSSASVTVINGSTDSTASVTVGALPNALSVNTATDYIYVANTGTNNVTVINGATNTVAATANAGTQPKAIAINMVTNMIYVANYGGTVTIINGSLNSPVRNITVGNEPDAIAVNQVTNRIYVANYGSNSVTVIDGVTTDTISTIPVGTGPNAIVVNPLTNKIYVSNYGSGNVTVINGATGLTTTLTVGTNPGAIAVNSATNKIYVANLGSGNVSVIDGAMGNVALMYPAHNATTVALTPTFKWSAATNATAYSIQISVNTAFSSFGNILNTGVTSDSLSFGLPTANRKYYWRVAGTHGSNTGAWTADSFTTGQFVPAVPTLSTPTNGATSVALTTTLSWNHAAGDTSYRVQVSSSLSFSNPNDTALAATARVIKLASSTALYYWRVEASNTYGTSLWSSVWSFTANSTGTLPDRPRYSGATMGYAGILAVYSLNGKQVLKIPFDAAATKEAVLRRAARIPATGVYKYCFLRDRKVMDGGSFMAK